MKNFLLPLCSVLALSFAFTACKKDKEEPKPAPTKTELLTGKNWNLKGFTVNPGVDYFGNGTLITDIYAQSPSTDKDDLERFDTPNAYKYDEGPTKAAGAVQTITGTWTFSTDEKVVTVTPQGSAPSSYEIMELTENNLKVKYTQVATSGITYTYERSYAR